MTLNLLAVGVSTVAGMLVGWLWFSPFLLGRPWATRAGVELGKAPGWIYPVALLATAITAVVLALAVPLVHTALGGSYLGVALGTAVVGWLGLTAGRAAVEYLFEKKALSLFAIDMGHHLAVLVVMALIIGLLGR